MQCLRLSNIHHSEAAEPLSIAQPVLSRPNLNLAQYPGVVELVDTYDLGSYALRKSSSLFARTSRIFKVSTR